MSLDRFEKMTQREKDEFSKICNKLMSATYMLRDGTDKLFQESTDLSKMSLNCSPIISA